MRPHAINGLAIVTGAYNFGFIHVVADSQSRPGIRVFLFGVALVNQQSAGDRANQQHCSRCVMLKIHREFVPVVAESIPGVCGPACRLADDVASRLFA
jgi:hypothetical protein